MLLFVLALAAADVAPADRAPVDAGGVVVDGASPRARSHDEHREPAPLWQYFVVPAGLSLTSSVLLAVPEAVMLPFLTLTTLSIALAGAPLVAGVGLSRLDGVSVGSYVGLGVGDVVGVVGGGLAGFVVFDQTLKSRFRADCTGANCVSDRVIGTVVAALVGAWVGRAVFGGVGSVVGQLVGPSDDVVSVH